jgi:hypothetical protein
MSLLRAPKNLTILAHTLLFFTSVMKRTFATYEHSRIGFPGYILKWTEENSRITEAYTVLKGVIEGPYTWREQYPAAYIESELGWFDDYTASRFSNDATVQG